MTRGELQWKAYLFVCTVVGFAALAIGYFALAMVGLDALKASTSEATRFLILIGFFGVMLFGGLWKGAYDWYREQARREEEHHVRNLREARIETDQWMAKAASLERRVIELERPPTTSANKEQPRARTKPKQ